MPTFNAKQSVVVGFVIQAKAGAVGIERADARDRNLMNATITVVFNPSRKGY